MYRMTGQSLMASGLVPKMNRAFTGIEFGGLPLSRVVVPRIMLVVVAAGAVTIAHILPHFIETYAYYIRFNRHRLVKKPAGDKDIRLRRSLRRLHYCGKTTLAA